MAAVTTKEKALRDRLLSLMNSWGRKSRKIERKKARAGDLGPPESLSPTLFGKLRKLIDQIAFFSEKERNIVSEINAVEQKHRALRKRKMLKRVRPKAVFAGMQPKPKDDRANRYWWLLFLFFLISRRRQAEGRKNAPKAG